MFSTWLWWLPLGFLLFPSSFQKIWVDELIMLNVPGGVNVFAWCPGWTGVHWKCIPACIPAQCSWERLQIHQTTLKLGSISACTRVMYSVRVRLTAFFNCLTNEYTHGVDDAGWGGTVNSTTKRKQEASLQPQRQVDFIKYSPHTQTPCSNSKRFSPAHFFLNSPTANMQDQDWGGKKLMKWKII